MDNKEFPEQEPLPAFPENLADSPVPVDLPQEIPVIEELTFSPDTPEIQDLPFTPAGEPEPAPLKQPELEEEEPQEAALPQLPEEDTAEESHTEPATEAPAAEPAEEPIAEASEATEESITELPTEAPAAEAASEEPAAEAVPPEAAPQEEPAPVQGLSDPEPVQEILPDRQAMDSHGMQDHGTEDPVDPELLTMLGQIPTAQEAPTPREEVLDQEYRDNGQDFDAMFHAPAPKKQEPQPERQTHKGRPKRKKGEGLLGIPNILVTVVWLALIVMIGVTLGRMLWVCAADVLAFGREDKVVTVTIYEADTMDDIIDKLYDNGLIRYKSLFQLYADISDAREDIKPGIYDLNARYDYHALVNFMSPRSSREVVTLTIPEGYTSRQIFALLEENRICTAVDAAAYAANGELNDYWFLEGVERGSETCLEGYLFPDTYEFYKNSTPREALQRMLNNFEIKFTEEMRAQLDALNASLTGDYTVREITIVASLIEKESAAPGESPDIAGVIYNRLFNWGSNPPYLNIDASIVYALGGKTDLTREDLQTDHPYNTYTNTGLTPGPISNPGLASLQAALNPEKHNYYFYVLNPATGMHQFSTTNEEHNAYVRQYAEGS